MSILYALPQLLQEKHVVGMSIPYPTLVIILGKTCSRDSQSAVPIVSWTPGGRNGSNRLAPIWGKCQFWGRLLDSHTGHTVQHNSMVRGHTILHSSLSQHRLLHSSLVTPSHCSLNLIMCTIIDHLYFWTYKPVICAIIGIFKPIVGGIIDRFYFEAISMP